MRNAPNDVPVGDKAPHEVNVESRNQGTSTRSSNYNSTWGVFVLDRTLFSRCTTPAITGSYPVLCLKTATAGCAVLTSHPVPMATVLAARPSAVLRMHDDKGRTTRLSASSHRDLALRGSRILNNLSDHRKKEIYISLRFTRSWKTRT